MNPDISSDRASTAGSGVADAAPLREGVTVDAAGADEALDTPLPCNVTVGGGTFRKGVSLRLFVGAAREWHRQAFPDQYLLTTEQKAANLAVLRGEPMLAAAPIPQQAAPAITDERIMELARAHTWFNGSHAMTNYVAFVRAILAEASHKKE